VALQLAGLGFCDPRAEDRRVADAVEGGPVLGGLAGVAVAQIGDLDPLVPHSARAGSDPRTGIWGYCAPERAAASSVRLIAAATDSLAAGSGGSLTPGVGMRR